MKKLKETPYKSKKRYYNIALQAMPTTDIKRFCAFLTQYGASQRTMEDRVRYRGFTQWEQLGIESIIRDIVDIPDHEDVDTRDFLCHLTRGPRNAFYMQMDDLGMCTNTIRTRFFDRSFRPWEMIGINKLYEKFVAETERGDELADDERES